MGAHTAAPHGPAPAEVSPFRLSRFMLGAARAAQFPSDTGWEAAIVGRSNAGKSSALNAITGLRGLARVSKLPGRTREINFFAVDEERRLVDLPGYGYARVPAAIKQAWQRLIEAYLEGRHSLQGMVIVMDCRHPLTEYDEHMLIWCATRRVPAHILLTKADKLSKGAAGAVLQQVRARVAREFKGADVTVQLFSALKRSGVDVAQQKLTGWLEMKQKKAPV